MSRFAGGTHSTPFSGAQGRMPATTIKTNSRHALKVTADCECDYLLGYRRLRRGRTNPTYEAGPLFGSADEDGLVALTGNAGLVAFISRPASFPNVRVARAKIPWSMPELSV